MDYEDELCQREGGLRRTEIMGDSAIHRQLLKEKCYCPKKDYVFMLYTFTAEKTEWK